MDWFLLLWVYACGVLIAPGVNPDTLFTLSRFLCVVLLSPQGPRQPWPELSVLCFHMENPRPNRNLPFLSSLP